jgi:uncharacterized protein (DUF1499 family)
MKTISIILFFSIITFFILFFVLGLASKSGKAAGLIDGRLSKCPDKPNCVCSEYKNNPHHYVEPIAIIQQVIPEVMADITGVILDMGGSIQSGNNHYLASTFTSRFFRFVDDLEIRIDPVEKLIHIRSMSRIGHSDLGVNSKRIELFKKLYKKKHSEADKPSRAASIGNER